MDTRAADWQRGLNGKTDMTAPRYKPTQADLAYRDAMFAKDELNPFEEAMLLQDISHACRRVGARLRRVPPVHRGQPDRRRRNRAHDRQSGIPGSRAALATQEVGDSRMQVGFIGLGSMGTAMALNLVKAGHEVRAWNRTKLAPDTIPGVTFVDLAQDAFQTDAVFTMLSDDAAMKAIPDDGRA
jgi:hypothetical protein